MSLLLNQRQSYSRVLRHITLLFLCVLLSACGSGSGGKQAQLDLEAAAAAASSANANNNGSDYSGPDPQTVDVQQFRLYLWENLMPQNRCGSCHGDGGQSPSFVRQDDINLAYAAANTVVNLSSPIESLMVQKVGGGHNCWLPSDSACADLITAYITNWAGNVVGGAKTIILTAPNLKDAGDSKNFPEDASLFSSNVHPLLTTYCAECHSDTAVVPQSPYFASADADVAYEAAKSKLDLDTPANSRFVVRLGSEFHNCWSSCGENSDEMLAAVSAFSNGIVQTSIDPDLVISKALQLGDGVLANSGGRDETNIVALYEFKTGTGTTAYDTSGIEPSLNLNLSGSYEWVGGWGVLYCKWLKSVTPGHE